MNGSELGKLAAPAPLDAGDLADVRAAGGANGADALLLPAGAVPEEPEAVLPPRAGVALVAVPVPPDCRTPVEPVALFPPPTWAVPVELEASLPEPPRSGLVEALEPAPDALAPVPRPPPWRTPVELEAPLPPPSCAAPVESDAVFPPPPNPPVDVTWACRPAAVAETDGLVCVWLA